MLKKGLIGLAIIALAGSGYWYYDDYQKKEKARLIKERDEQIARDLQRMKENSIKEAIAEKERKKKKFEEEKARQKRIAEGNPIIEEIVTYYPRTKQKKEQYTLVEGKKEGKGITWYENGQIKESMNYKNGELDGLCVDYYFNKRRETNYLQGRKHGVFIRWNADNKKEVEENYDNGRLEGARYEWRDDGVTVHSAYKNNKLLKSESYYPSGEKRSLEIYVPEQDIVQSIFWYEDGTISFEGYKKQYLSLKTDLFPAGVYYYYRPSGQKFLELPYINKYRNHGFKFGTCYRWNNENKIITEIKIDDSIEDWDKYYKILKGTIKDCELTKNERQMIFGLSEY